MQTESHLRFLNNIIPHEKNENDNSGFSKEDFSSLFIQQEIFWGFLLFFCLKLC